MRKKGTFISLARFNALGKEQGLKLKGERLVVHYQIHLNETVVLEKLERVFKQAWEQRGQESGMSDANASVY